MKFAPTLLSIVAFASLLGFASQAQGQEYRQQTLFANQYTQGNANRATAQMYIAPVPVPPWVGHTYYTYEPLYPHEMMYLHKNRYHNYYDNGRGLNSTTVSYYVPPVRTAVHGVWNTLSIARP